MDKELELKVLESKFSICKVENLDKVNCQDEFCFIGKTDEEISVVCQTKYVPENIIERDDEWRGFRIQGVLDFSLIGILAKISTILADNEIGIFVVSTFNTDYIFTKENNFQRALSLLEKNGYSYKTQ